MAKERRIAPNGLTLTPKEDRVITYMEDHGSITPAEAEKHLHDHRLAASIHTLRHKGYDIDTIRVDMVNAYGEDTWFGRYVFGKGE